MHIKNLRLNPFTIDFLYHKDLVLIDKDIPKEKVGDKQFLGNNSRKITLLVEEQEAVFIAENDLQVLSKMLLACKLSIEDVAIVNVAAKKINWANCKTILHTEKLILFGVSPTDFGMPILFPSYHLQEYDHTTCLYADTIRNIAMDPLLKSKLWICLQSMFLH